MNTDEQEPLTIFSPDRQYRYLLTRRWSTFGEDRGELGFIMLNPSTADETKNDPTVTRCENRARDEGYSAVNILNLFALRSTDPKVLYSHTSPIEHQYFYNDSVILHTVSKCDKVICAWGGHGTFMQRGLAVSNVLKEFGYQDRVFALALTKHGMPRHPLYLKKDLTPMPFSL